MPVPTAPHYRLALTQTLGSGEVMVTTVKLAQGTPNPKGVVGDTAEQVATTALPAFNAWTTAVKARRVSVWNPIQFDVYKIGGDGLASEQAQRIPTSTPGTYAGAALPLETAMVLTLQTGAPGARRRGRTFLGGFGVAIMDTPTDRRGKFIAASVLAEVQAFRDLLYALDVAFTPATGNPLNPVVVSNVLAEAYTITAVRGGDVPDVQRRRNTAQTETYQTVAVLP